ncbi:MAG: DUF4388 domain-containing protein [Proteobacteria bacterium]|nr:DUF4388 domain-containing protein [Pseudomonadota bacterium]
MAPLQGSLEDFDITDILELINIAKKDGALEITSGDYTGIIYFENGVVVDVSTGDYKGDDAIHRILRWNKGKFFFDPHKSAAEKTLNIPIQKLMIEAARQLDEWKKIEQVIPSVNVVLKLNENPPTEDNEVSFTDEDWKVLSVVDGTKTLKEIARELAISEFETGRIVYNLVSAGFIILGEERNDTDQTDEPEEKNNETENNNNNPKSEYSSRKKKKKGGLFGRF